MKPKVWDVISNKNPDTSLISGYLDYFYIQK
jgi:hypothetical protein